MAYRVALHLLFIVTVVCSVCQLQNDKYGRHFFHFVNLRFRACSPVSVAPSSFRYFGFVCLDVPFFLRSVCLSGLQVPVISLCKWHPLIK